MKGIIDIFKKNNMDGGGGGGDWFLKQRWKVEDDFKANCAQVDSIWFYVLIDDLLIFFIFKYAKLIRYFLIDLSIWSLKSDFWFLV